jgi:Tfp pilus assembly protein PilN
MYRINLYPAGAVRRTQRTRVLGRAALVAVLGAVNVVLLGLFFTTAMNVRVQADQAEQLVAQQRQRLTQSMKGNRAVPNQIRLVVERRNERMAWAPVLGDVAVLLPDNLIIDLIEGGAATAEGARTGMTLSGHLRAGRNMDQVIEFTRRLSESPVYTSQFGEARLGSMETVEDVARFRISCPLLVHAPPDSTPGDVAG